MSLMTASTWPRRIFVTAAFLCPVACASTDEFAWQGDVRVDGALRQIFHGGQTGTMVTLDELMPDRELYAVGALSNLDGEVTIVGGTAHLSHPDGDRALTKVVEQSNAGATLLVSARVATWRPFTVESPIRFENLDDEVAKLATAAGMDLSSRFPFMIEGELEDLRWHVIDGSRLPAGDTSHEDHLRAAIVLSREHTAATLIGFYSKRDHGVFTHRDSNTHLHCLVESPISSGHVDHVIIPAGTTILFPE